MIDVKPLVEQTLSEAYSATIHLQTERCQMSWILKGHRFFSTIKRIMHNKNIVLIFVGNRTSAVHYSIDRLQLKHTMVLGFGTR